jgi:hypothetical protein
MTVHSVSFRMIVVAALIELSHTADQARQKAVRERSAGVMLLLLR